MRSVSLAILLLAATGPALAKTCEVTVESNDQMKFDKAEIAIAADCTEVALTLKHTGTLAAEVMGHNWVLAKTDEYRPLAIAGGRETAETSFLPKDDARAIAFTPVIGGGETTSVTFSTDKLEAGGDYTFFCSFPGHWGVMKGKLTFG